MQLEQNKILVGYGWNHGQIFHPYLEYQYLLLIYE